MKLKKHNRYAYSPIVERQDFDWPGGKRIAFYCALNVEHFSFGEGLGHTPTALGPQPDVRNYGWRDYGLRVGIWRIFDMMDELKWPMCHLINASVCEEMPQITARIRQRNDEPIGHGYTNSERQVRHGRGDRGRDDRARDEDIGRSCGRRPYGWMGPWISETPVTPDLLAGERLHLRDGLARRRPAVLDEDAQGPHPVGALSGRAQRHADHARPRPARDRLPPHDPRPVRGNAAAVAAAAAGDRHLDAHVLHRPAVPAGAGAGALETLAKHPGFGKVWVTTPGGIAEYAAGLGEGRVV
jgi:allantoinase